MEWTIEKIKQAEIHGYFGPNDSSLWAEMDRLIMDESQPFELRVAASKKVDDICGDYDSFANMSDSERLEAHVQCLKEVYDE